MPERLAVSTVSVNVLLYESWSSYPLALGTDVQLNAGLMGTLVALFAGAESRVVPGVPLTVMAILVVLLILPEMPFTVAVNAPGVASPLMVITEILPGVTGFTEKDALAPGGRLVALRVTG